MGFAEFYFIESGLFFGFVVAVGLAVISLNQPDFKVARRCAILAAILFGSIGMVWGVTTPESIWIRIPAVGLVGLVMAISLSESLRFVMKREILAVPELPKTNPVREAPAPPPSGNKSGGSSFMKIGQGASVEGLTIQRGQIEGVNTVFDVDGKLKDTNLQDFKSSSFGPNAAAHLKTMTIGRVSFAAPKIGIVQPSLPTNTRNPDGTITSTMSFTIDEGVTTNLIIGMRAGGVIGYEMFQDGKLVQTPWARTNDGYLLRRMDNAAGIYSAKIHRKNDIETLEIGIDTASLNRDR
jgi:hypothetical protein